MSEKPLFIKRGREWVPEKPAPMKPAGTTPAEGGQERPVAGGSSQSAPTLKKPPLPDLIEIHPRDSREVREVRVCCLAAAVEFVNSDRDKSPDRPPILTIAEMFEEWVWRELEEGGERDYIPEEGGTA